MCVAMSAISAQIAGISIRSTRSDWNPSRNDANVVHGPRNTGVVLLRIAIDWKVAGQQLALFSAIGGFLAFINPYNASQGSNFLWSFLYWTGLIIVGGLTGRAGVIAAERLQRPPHWATAILLSSAAASFGVTIAIYLLEMVRAWTINIPLWYFPRIYGLVFVISLGVASITYLFDRVQEAPPVQETNGDPVAKFLERLPVKYRTAELYAISSEDHYLRIHTSLGEEMILMRLADALRELADADGLQTHRSWWVSRAGVAEARRENGKLVLELKSGGEAPVSRTYTTAVKEAGLAN